MNSDNLEDLVGNLCDIILRVRTALKLEINEETGLYCTSYSGEVASTSAQKESCVVRTLEYDSSSDISVLKGENIQNQLAKLAQSEGKQHQLVEISLCDIIKKQVYLIVDMPTTYLCGIRKGDEYYHIGNDDDCVVTILKKCKASKELSSSAAYDDHDEMLWNWSANYNQNLMNFFGKCTLLSPSILSDQDISKISKKQLDEFIALVFELARHPGLYNNVIKSLKNPNGTLDIKQIINVGKEWNKGNVSETKVNSCKEYDLINSLGNLGDVLCASYIKLSKGYQNVDRLFYYAICQYHMILDNIQYLGSDGQNKDVQKALEDYINSMSELSTMLKQEDLTERDNLVKLLKEMVKNSDSQKSLKSLLNKIKDNKNQSKSLLPANLLGHYVSVQEITYENVFYLTEIALKYNVFDEFIRTLKENQKLDEKYLKEIILAIKGTDLLRDTKCSSLMYFASRHDILTQMLKLLFDENDKIAERFNKIMKVMVNKINVKDILEIIYTKYSLDEVVNFAKEQKIVPQMLEMFLGKQLFNETANDIGARNIIAFAKQYELIPEMIKVLTDQFGKFALPVGKELHTVGKYENKKSIMKDLVTALNNELSEKTKTVTQQQAVNPQQVSNFNNLLARVEEAIKFLDESWCKSLIEPIIEKARAAVSEAKSKLNLGSPK